MKTRQKSSNKKERKLLKLSEKAPEKSTEKHIKNIVLVRIEENHICFKKTT